MGIRVGSLWPVRGSELGLGYQSSLVCDGSKAHRYERDLEKKISML